MKNQITPVKGKWYVDDDGDLFLFKRKIGNEFHGQYLSGFFGIWHIAEIKREATEKEITEAKKQMV